MNIQLLAQHPAKLAPPHAQVVRGGDPVDLFARRGVEPGHEGVGVGAAAVDLRGQDLVADVLREALVERGLGPVDAKVPVAPALLEAGVLLEDGAGDTELVNFNFRKS